MTILIIAPHDDDHAVPVRAELERRGVRVVTFDLAEIPQRASISVSFEGLGVGPRAVVERASEPFDLDAIETIWLRRVTTPAPPPLSDRWWAVAEAQHCLVGLAQALHDRRWVNPLGSLALDGGWGKVRQLQAARALGLEIPRTLVTNSPAKAREFVASCASGAIYKPLASREGVDRNGQRTAIFTTEVATDAALDAVAHAPCIFQEKIAKRVEIRATVLGERVFAVEIHSQTAAASAIDYRRRYLDVPHAVHALPEDVSGRLVALHRALGLAFGTSDLILTPEGRYVFLEVNVAGQFLWTGLKTGVPMASHMADLLMGQ